ncbi:uncharacterized protein A4U43_C05F3710 [Asparagus officinalis]|uniref:Uncharacterized protein n=1 Tax=Asparagus officinalis TaxID=4686 RepID=A0A5P1ETB1_ASPOF|nr:uncharacterized protein A4U43_C05F3710 [Asparagus officinalis]
MNHDVPPHPRRRLLRSNPSEEKLPDRDHVPSADLADLVGGCDRRWVVHLLLEPFDDGFGLWGMHSEMSHIDPALTRFNQIVSERALPEKGKLLDAVMRVGPMLQSFMIAGPLPQWKNPSLLQQNKILPVSV